MSGAHRPNSIRRKPIYHPEIEIYPAKVCDGSGKERSFELFEAAVKSQHVGDTICHSVAAPGTGYVKYRITRIDQTGVYGRVIEDTVRILEPWEVE